MTNITELAQSLKRRATSANEFGESLYVKGADVIALVEALERKEEQRANWSQMAQKLGEDLDAAEKRLAELEAQNEYIRKRYQQLDLLIGKNILVISSKAFWSGAGKNENFHPETYRRWVKEVIERYCAIARINVEVK